jgi:predicted Zn-dependent protease
LHGECKEVLFVCENAAEKEPCIVVASLTSQAGPASKASEACFTFSPAEEASAEAVYCTAVGRYLYDPHAAERVVGELAAWAADQGVQSIGELVGAFES